jgi:hypothetical protein
MPVAFLEPHPHAQNEHRPSPLIGLWVRLRANRLDRALAGGASPNGSAELGVRADQLVDERERNRIADWIQNVLDLAEQDQPILLGPTRLLIERGRIEASRTQLERIVEILRGSSPVSPRGVAMARRLITDFRGPIYTGGRNSRLPEALAATRSALS